tara:strand:- start:167 stop:892 length:726 start_codon:yes stop_codon:yes gene_type:complete
MSNKGDVNQDISGNDNIQINSGNDTITAIGEGAMAVGGDFIQQMDPDIIDNLNLRLEKISHQTDVVLKLLEPPSRGRLNDSWQEPEQEMDDLEALFAEVDLNRKPNPDWPDTPDYATMVMYKDHSDERNSKIYLGHTDSGKNPVLIQMGILRSIQNGKRETLVNLSTRADLISQEQVEDISLNELSKILIHNLVLDNMDLTPSVLIQLSKDSIYNLCKIFRIEVANDFHNNLQLLNEYLNS